jgi:hypothetical protein
VPPPLVANALSAEIARRRPEGRLAHRDNGALVLSVGGRAARPATPGRWLGIWCGWVLLTTLAASGLPALGLTLLALAALPEPQSEPWPQLLGLLGYAANGALVGAAQWVLLRRLFDAAGWWVAATALGTAVPLQVMLGARGAFPLDLFMLVFPLIVLLHHLVGHAASS